MPQNCTWTLSCTKCHEPTIKIELLDNNKPYVQIGSQCFSFYSDGIPEIYCYTCRQTLTPQEKERLRIHPGAMQSNNSKPTKGENE